MIKIIQTLTIALSALFVLSVEAMAETVHQTLKGEVAKAGDGSSAVAKKLMEIKSLPEGNVARLVSSINQWGYVTYWFGLPTPAGKSTVRLRIYVEGRINGFAVYIKKADGDPFMTKIELPQDAAQNSFVNVDIPVDLPQEWNGLILKKIVASDEPGPWIESVSIILP